MSDQITSLDVGLWTPVMSPGLGTLSWGCAVETLTDLETGEAKLMADPIYLDQVDRGATFTTGGVDDRVAQFLSMPASDPAANHVAVVEAQIANGNFQHGVAVGIQIAELATKTSGLPTAFLLGTTGAYAGCAWLTSATSLKELEDGENAVNANPEFIALLDGEASTAYLAGATQTLWRRII